MIKITTGRQTFFFIFRRSTYFEARHVRNTTLAGVFIFWPLAAINAY